jgi:hypothetical protein
MDKLSDTPTRDEVLSFIFASSTYGNLGLFVGSGFSKAVLNGDEEIALSWGELLKEAAKKIGVDYSNVEKMGMSFPEIATALCHAHFEAKGCDFDKSRRTLKHKIAEMTAWFPSQAQRSEYSKYLDSLAPAWIVTTNYDQVLECLLSGRAISIGPNDPLSHPMNLVPIFHLHGVRTNPEEIIITQGDYIKLFRPSEYRQLRLALMLKESTTLLLGYALGDVNVLTALDWSKNVFDRKQGKYPHEVIQVLFQPKLAKNEPYRSKDGVVILETSKISAFFREYETVATKLREQEAEKQNGLLQMESTLRSGEPDLISAFIDESDFRQGILKFISSFNVDLIAAFEEFLEKCFKETRRRSGKMGDFQAYADDLSITLYLLTAFSFSDFPTALFPVASRNLDRLAKFIGRERGCSWAAYNVWERRKIELSEEIIGELQVISQQYQLGNLRSLLAKLQTN